MTPANLQAVAVYCASSMSTRTSHCNAAISVGLALAKHHRRLVYGGGSQGLMGLVSKAVLEDGGNVTGIVPFAILEGGSERSKISTDAIVLTEPENDKGILEHDCYEQIIVESMHERKVLMARLSDGFIGLPGGFGTFEEVLESVTWNQLGIHAKPVILVNVEKFWEPLRLLIRQAQQSGLIQNETQQFITIVDGPENLEEHVSYDWGTATLKAFDEWDRDKLAPMFNWSKRRGADEPLRDVMEENNLSMT